MKGKIKKRFKKRKVIEESLALHKELVDKFGLKTSYIGAVVEWKNAMISLPFDDEYAMIVEKEEDNSYVVHLGDFAVKTVAGEEKEAELMRFLMKAVNENNPTEWIYD